MKKEIQYNPDLVAYCGLYCGACSKYLRGKCPGCHEYEKATWCGVRKCCIENQYSSCADCKKKELSDCKEFNSFFAKLFGFIFRSDRAACIERIKSIGKEEFAREMTSNRMITIKK